VAYTFDPIFAADPSNPANVAANAAILIYDPNDAGKAPVTITDLTGSPLPNPVTVNKNGFGSAFQHATLDRLAWSGAGFEGFFTSYEGMKSEAVAARTAAETAAANAAVAATEGVAPVVAEAEAAADAAAAAQAAAASSATAAANSAALVGAPADTAMAAAANNTGSQFRAALSATIATQVAAPISAAIAPVAARPLVTAVVPLKSVSDSIVHVRQGSANAVMLRQTDLTRQVAIIQNLGANDMMVAEGTNGSLATPGSGYVTVATGQEYVTASTKPVFAYMSTTAATARVYCAQGV